MLDVENKLGCCLNTPAGAWTLSGGGNIGIDSGKA